MKKTAVFLAAFGILALTGAGCAGNDDTGNNSPTGTDGQNNTTTPTSTTTIGNSDFKITVTPLGGGRVRVDWTKPDDVDQNDRVRVLHASRAGSDRPFWRQFLPSVSTTELSNVATGTRFFKVCEFKDNKYERCSDEVEVQVN